MRPTRARRFDPLELRLGPLRDTLARRTRWSSVARCTFPQDRQE